MRLNAPLTLLLALVGCTSSTPFVTGNAGQVKETIRCVAKAGVDRTAVLQTAADFGKLSGVLDVAAAYELDDEIGKESRAVLFYLTFADEASMKRVTAGQAYDGIVRGKLGPLCEEVKRTDTTLQNYLVSDEVVQETTAATLQRRAAAVQQQNDLRNRTK